MANGVKAIRGMNDILPDESYLWVHFEQIIQQWLAAYGYRNIRTPIVEQTDLFARSIGEVTDIVEKEMYTFIDHLNNDSLTLRPEGTTASKGTISTIPSGGSGSVRVCRTRYRC